MLERKAVWIFPGLKLIPPVVSPPRVRFPLSKLCIVPSPLNTNPEPEPPDDVVADIEAIGDVDPATLRNANLEDMVDVPPTRRSTVELPGNRVPADELRFQYPTVPDVAHVLPDTHIVPDASGKIIDLAAVAAEESVVK